MSDKFDESEEPEFVRGATFILEKLRDDVRGVLGEPNNATDDEQAATPADDLYNEIGRARNDAMQQLYSVRDLAHLLDIAEDRAGTVGFVIEREAERGVECMNRLERLLVGAERRGYPSSAETGTEPDAYQRGHRDAFWHAVQAIKGCASSANASEPGLRIRRLASSYWRCSVSGSRQARWTS